MTDCCSTPTTPPARIPPVEFCVGNYTMVYQDGRMVKVPRQPKIADGVYVNPTITMVDGCVVAIEAGTAVLYSECDPCATPAPTPPPATIAIDGSGCNLVSNGPSGLIAALVTTPSSCISFSGCGTAGAPLQAAPIISPDAGNALECRPNGLYSASAAPPSGVNFVGCGITVTNGLITALPLPFQPVLEIVADPNGSVTVTRDATNPCRVTIGGGAFSGGDIPGFVLTKGIKLFAASTDLPADPSVDGFYWGAVGAANPRQLWGFVDGSGWRQIFDSTSSSLQIVI
jgi:hypothetical protein